MNIFDSTTRTAVAGANIDAATVEGFGDEWDSFDQTALTSAEWQMLFNRYFAIFPWQLLSAQAEGFDLGCGSGRWAAGVAGRVGTLHCIDASTKALAVARRRLSAASNARFHAAGVDAIPLADESQDFGYSLGVLHHIPDTQAALTDCVRKLKTGAPFLVYLYYRFDNKPAWFKRVWEISDVVRRGIAQLPFAARKGVTSAIAATIYWPVARAARVAEMLGAKVDDVPLAPYRRSSFYSMRTDALDRFGTRLEQRFTRNEVEAMMRRAGLADIRFSEDVPFWVACGIKA